MSIYITMMMMIELDPELLDYNALEKEFENVDMNS